MQDFLTEVQKQEYIKLLTLQNDNFCQLVVYYYIQSQICSSEERALASKYDLFSKIDKALIFSR